MVMISSESPESLALEGLSEEQLGEQLDQAEASGSTNVETKVPEAKVEAPKVEAAAVEGSAPVTEPSPLEAKIAALEKRLTSLGKETGQGRAMQAKIASLEKRLEQRSQETQTQLSPEEQEAEKQLDTRFKAFVEQNYGHLIQDATFQRENAQYRSEVQGLCNEMGIPFEQINPILGELLDADLKAADEGDDAAQARLDKCLAPGGQAYLAFRGAQELSKRIQAKGADFQSGKSEEAKKLSQTVKFSPGNRDAAKPKGLGDMSQAEFDKLPLDQMEKMLDAAGA